MMRQMSLGESEWTTAGENFSEGAADQGSAPSSGGQRLSGNMVEATSPRSRVREVRGGKVPTSQHLTKHIDSLQEVLLPGDSRTIHLCTADTSAEVHHGNPDRGHRRARSEPFSHRS